MNVPSHNDFENIVTEFTQRDSIVSSILFMSLAYFISFNIRKPHTYMPLKYEVMMLWLFVFGIPYTIYFMCKVCFILVYR